MGAGLRLIVLTLHTGAIREKLDFAIKMKIAKIVGSNSHIAYIARVIDERDGEVLPGPDDYGFGRFVSMPFDNGSIVGVICDSRLVNPEYMGYSPRTTSMPALSDLKRDLIDEQKALIGILLLGSVNDGLPVHELPRRVVPAGQFVYAMNADDVAEFHFAGAGTVQLHYFPNLMANAGSLAVPLAKSIIGQLEAKCSEHDRQRLAVMASALTWKHTFGEIRF